MDRIKRFFDVYVPVKSCNLKCHYCYVTEDAKSKMGDTAFEYTPEQIGRALAIERLGGKCLFHICGYGETLIPPEIAEIIKEILKQGHYVFVVTNGLISKRIDQILEFPQEYLTRLGFKFSFHYLELLRTNQLEKFTYNVSRVRTAGCSISVEVTPSDELEPYIDEMRRYSIEKFGALPHITVPRNGDDPSWPLLSKRSLQEFKDIWGQFESELFDFKLSTWGIKRKEYCYAGAWSGLLNIGNGELSRCYGGKYSQNILKDPTKPIIDLPIGNKCSMPHCVNSHIFLTLGDIQSINSYTYAQVRNRVCADGSEWLREPMKSFISGRLEDANEILTEKKKKLLAWKSFLLVLRYQLFKRLYTLLSRKIRLILEKNKLIPAPRYCCSFGSVIMRHIFKKAKKAPRYAKARIERCYYTLRYRFAKGSIYIKTESIETTIQKIIDEKVSVSRFGDGEFKWIEKLRHNSFQDVDEKLSERLLEVLRSESERHIVCISPAFSGLEYETEESKKYWRAVLGQYGKRWARHLDRSRVYFNANISRFYLNDINKALVNSRFLQLKKIWDGRDLLIVEGEMSRMGAGNDLFENARSIQRLIAPKRNAFSRYDAILEKAKRYGKEKLILIALGPTATVLAYDLAMSGYQAIDLGHVDIEYEWYLMGATKKVPVRWREVNEARTANEIPFTGPERVKYDSQIIDAVLL